MKRKSLRNYLYFLSLIPTSITIFGNINGGFLVFGNILLSLGILPILEIILGDNKDKEEGENNDIPQLIIYLHVIFQTLCILSAFYGILINNNSGLELLGIIIATGINSGSSAIVIAHELIHRRSKLELIMGKFMLFTSFNIYFYIDHIFVHHKYVGTDKDPATSRKGESVFAFAYRSFAGQIISSFKLESKRLEKINKSKWGFNNYVMKNAYLQILLLITLFLVNPMLFVFYITQGIIACYLLEFINYIEHYGLSRDEKTRVNESHSWNSDKIVSRVMLIDLSRHADHHYYAHKHYHTLTTFENSPNLPTGYFGCFYLANIPPLWFKLMHPKIDAINIKITENTAIN